MMTLADPPTPLWNISCWTQSFQIIYF